MNNARRANVGYSAWERGTREARISQAARFSALPENVGYDVLQRLQYTIIKCPATFTLISALDQLAFERSRVGERALIAPEG